MAWGWCKDCGGETVSCECVEMEDNYDGPDGDDSYEETVDSRVVWVVNDDGVGRVEVV